MKDTKHSFDSHKGFNYLDPNPNQTTEIPISPSCF